MTETRVRVRTSYQGPADLPSGKVRGPRIVVERQNYDNWTRTSYPYDDLGGPDRHAAAVVRYATERLGREATVESITMTGIDARERQQWVIA